MSLRKRRRRGAAALPTLWVEMWFAAAETVAWRSLMMFNGTCSPAEYQRMVEEKWVALGQSAVALAAPAGPEAAAMLRPWHRHAAANARRLRRQES